MNYVEKYYKKNLEASYRIKEKILSDEKTVSAVNDLIAKAADAVKNSHTIFFAGNGGSFADSIHLSAEFVVRYKKDRRPIPSIALGCNNSAVFAAGNDYSFEDILLREFKALSKKEDLLILLSTSGNSKNILALAEYAAGAGNPVYGLTGETGGKLKDLCRCICVPSQETARIQEAHMLIGHTMCEAMDDLL